MEKGTTWTAEPEADGVEALARESTWLLIEAAFAFWGHFVARAAQLGLAPTQAHALLVMDSARPATMRDVAEALACDPSTITGVADRLEGQGLVERQSQARDRRVRALVLTSAGAERRAQLVERLAQPPDSVSGLDHHQLRTLRTILDRVLAAEAKATSPSARCLSGTSNTSPPGGHDLDRDVAGEGGLEPSVAWPRVGDA